MEKIISFKNFNFQYTAQKQPTLKNIDLDIYRGEKILICGPSGSGKSTLGNCINGLIPFSYEGSITGSLIVDGIETSKSSIFELSNHVGTVLQDMDGQFIGLTVAEDIAFLMENDCCSQTEMIRTVKKLAAEVDVSSVLDFSPADISGGQKQRVSLAGVLVNNAPILLFDEPLANLDPKTGKSAIELIDNISRDKDTTCIIIEHRLEDALWRSVDRIILMNEGEIVADKSPDELLCTDLLSEYGIREPLYLTCAKYANASIAPEKKPAHVDSFALDTEDIQKIRSWYEKTKIEPARISDDIILKAENISFTYPGKINETLHNVSFEIRKGEMLSIAGKNGAGKSTLAKLICGFEDIKSGKIYFNGQDVTGDSIRSRSKHIGYVMQNPNQMISQSMVFDEVSLGIRGSGLSDKEVEEKVFDALKVCGIYEFRNWPVSALSYGQKKRVTIASILVMGPEIIILDEPTAGQDFKHYTDIMEFLKGLNSKGITIIMITHDMHLMLEYTSRTLVLVDGRLIADKPSSAVLCDAALVDKSSLKETSLFSLAQKCNIEDAANFTDCFIAFDREVRNGR